MFIEVGGKCFKFGKGAFIMIILVAVLAIYSGAYKGWLTAVWVDTHSGDGIVRFTLEILRLFNEEL